MKLTQEAVDQSYLKIVTENKIPYTQDGFDLLHSLIVKDLGISKESISIENPSMFDRNERNVKIKLNN